MFLRIIFLVLIVCQDLVLKWSLCQLLFSVVCERVGHALRPMFMLWLAKFDRWVYAENLYSILKLVYCDSWSWQSFVSTWDVFNCLFLLDVGNEIQLLSRVLCYSWLVCLLGFLVKKYVACQSRKSDFGWHRFVFVFHLAWLKSLKRCSFQELPE